MIKIFILICFITFATLSCSESKEIQYSDHIENNKDSINYLHFFEKYPNRFEGVEQRYSHSSEDPLYVDFTQDLPYLFENKKYVDETLFYKKMVDISSGGKWAPDAVNRLQILVRKEFYMNCLAITKFMRDNYNDTSLNSFFYFFFDEIHPDLAWENGLPDCFKKSDCPDRIRNIAKNQFNKVMSKF